MPKGVKAQDYLISLKFDAQFLQSLNADQIVNLAREVSVLQKSFQYLEAEMPGITKAMSSTAEGVNEYLDSIRQRLQEVATQMATTIKSISAVGVQMEGAFGDVERYKVSIKAPTGKGKYDALDGGGAKIFRSQSADAIPYFDNTGQQRNSGADTTIIAERFTDLVSQTINGLGDDVQKSVLKFGIQQALGNANEELRRFLEENLDHIEQFVTSAKMYYDTDGKAIRSWVQIRKDAYHTIDVTSEYGERNLINVKDGDPNSIGTDIRSSQIASVDIQGILSDYKKLYAEQLKAFQTYQEAVKTGSDEIIEKALAHKSAVEREADALAELYVTEKRGQDLYGDTKAGEISAYDTLRDIQNQVKQSLELRTINKEISEEKKKQSEDSKKKSEEEIQDAKKLADAMKEYTTLLAEKKKLESAGSDKYGEQIEKDKSRMKELEKEISQLSNGYVWINKQTQQLESFQSGLVADFDSNEKALGIISKAIEDANKKISDSNVTEAQKKEAEAIEETIEKMKQLTKAKQEMIKMQAQGKSETELKVQQDYIDELEKQLNDLARERVTSSKSGNQILISSTQDYKEAKAQQNEALQTTALKQYKEVLDSISEQYRELERLSRELKSAEESKNQTLQASLKDQISSLKENISQREKLVKTIGEQAEITRTQSNETLKALKTQASTEVDAEQKSQQASDSAKKAITEREQKVKDIIKALQEYGALQQKIMKESAKSQTDSSVVPELQLDTQKLEEVKKRLIGLDDTLFAIDATTKKFTFSSNELSTVFGNDAKSAEAVNNAWKKVEQSFADSSIAQVKTALDELTKAQNEYASIYSQLSQAKVKGNTEEIRLLGSTLNEQEKLIKSKQAEAEQLIQEANLLDGIQLSRKQLINDTKEQALQEIELSKAKQKDDERDATRKEAINALNEKTKEYLEVMKLISKLEFTTITDDSQIPFLVQAKGKAEALKNEINSLSDSYIRFDTATEAFVEDTTKMGAVVQNDVELQQQLKQSIQDLNNEVSATNYSSIEEGLKRIKQLYGELYTAWEKEKNAELAGREEEAQAYKTEQDSIQKVINNVIELIKKKKEERGIDIDDSISNIYEREYNQRQILYNAIQADAEARRLENEKIKETQEVTKSIEAETKKYISLLAEIDKIQHSGSDKQQAKAEYDKTQIEQSVKALNDALAESGQQVLEYDRITGQIIVDTTKLSDAYKGNQTIINALTEAEKKLNQAMSQRQADASVQEDTKKIDEAIQKLKELTKAKSEANRIKVQGGSAEDLQRASETVSRLTGELDTLTSATLSNGQAVEKTTDYTKAFTKAQEEEAEASLKAAEGASHHTSILAKLFGNFGQVISNVVKYNLVQGGLNQTITKTYGTMKELDAELTNIRLVTGETESQTRKMLNTYSEMAKELSSTTTAVAEGSIEWLRQGKTAEETNQLLRASTMLSKLGMMDATVASEKLTATLNGYQFSAQEAVGVVDKLVNVDLVAATSADELATALQYVASQANAANIPFDQLIGLIGTASETTRLSAESIGNAFKSIISRMNNIKINKFVDDNGEALNDTEKVLAKFDIALRDSNKEWRDLGEIINDIGMKWSSLTNVEKDAIGVAVAGTRQRNIFVAAMENYDRVLDLTKESAEAAGTSERKYLAFMESMEAKLNQLSTTWEQFVNNINVKGTFNGIIDALISIVGIIDKLVNTWGIIQHLGIPLAVGVLATKLSSGLGSAIKEVTEDLGKFKTGVQYAMLIFNSHIEEGMKKGKAFKETLSELKTDATFASAGFSALTSVIGILSAVITFAITQYQEYQAKIREGIISSGEAAKTYSDESDKIDELTKEYEKLNKSLEENRGNEEKTKEIKSEMINVQNELNSLYVDEHANLQLVNGEYERQIEDIKRLNKEKANAFMSENQEQYNNSVKLLDEEKYFDLGQMNKFSNEMKNAIRNNFGDNFLIGADDGWIYSDFIIDTEHAKEKLIEFSTFLRETAEKTGDDVTQLTTKISKHINELDTAAIESAKNVALQYSKAYIQTTSDTKIQDSYNKLTDSVKKYNEEISKANPDFSKLNELKLNIDEISNSFDELPKDAKRAFSDLIKSVDTSRDAYYKLKNSWQQIPEQILDGWKNAFTGYSWDELMAGGIQVFDNIKNTAMKAGVSVEEFKAILISFGLVEKEVSEEVTTSIEDMLNALEERLKNQGITDGFNSIMDNVAGTFSGLVAGYETLTDAVDEFNTYGLITDKTLKNLAKNDLVQYLELTADGFQINKQAMADNANTAIELAKEQIKEVAVQRILAASIEEVKEAEEETTEATVPYGTALNELTPIIDELFEKSISLAEAIYLVEEKMFGLGANIGNSFDSKVSEILIDTMNTANLIDRMTSGFGKSIVKTNSSSAKSAAKDAKKEIEDERKAVENLQEITMKYLKQKYKDIEEGYKKEKELENERFKEWKDNFSKEKELRDREVDDEIYALEQLRDQEDEDYEKRIKDLDKEAKAYQKKIKAQKDLLELKKKEGKYERELADKLKDVAKLESDLAKIQFDDSIEAQKKKIELTEKLAEKQKAVNEYQSDNAYDLQKDALDKEWDAYKEASDQKKEDLKEERETQKDYYKQRIQEIKREYELWKREQQDKEWAEEAAHNAEIKRIEDLIEGNKEYYEVDGNLMKEFYELAEKKSDEYYNNLIEWNRQYGSGVDEDVKQKWDAAYEVLDKYNYKSIGVKGVLEEIAKAIKIASDKMSEFGSTSEKTASGVGLINTELSDLLNKEKEAIKLAKNLSDSFDSLNTPTLMENYSPETRSQMTPTEYKIVDANELKSFAEKYNSAKTSEKASILFNAYKAGFTSTQVTETAKKLKKNHTGDPYVQPSESERQISKALGLKSDEVVRILKAGEAVIPKDENMNKLKKYSNRFDGNISKKTNELSENSKTYSSENNVSVSIGDIVINGDADSRTIDKLNECRKSIIEDVFSKINKHTDLSGFRSIKKYV